MSEEMQDVQQEEVIDYKAMYEETLKRLDAVDAKKKELLTEAQKAKKARDEATMQAQREAEERQKRDGEFEKLWQTADAQKKELEQRLNDFKNQVRTEKLTTASMRVANEIANDAANAELLHHFVNQKIAGLADENGVVSDDILKAVKQEFMTDKKYAALIAGRPSSGGSAPGSVHSTKSEDTVDRATFMKWSPAKQMSYVKSGKTLTD